MDEKNDGILIKVLTNEEIIQVREDIRGKIENYFATRIAEILTKNALDETAKNTLEEVRENYEKQVVELNSTIQDYDAKFNQSQLLISELREQLDNSREEVKRLLETTKRYEIESNECRQERNDAIDERDSLLKMIERRNTEVEMLRSDVKALETQLHQASASKCEALAKVDEIRSKELTLQFKESRMEKERIMLQNQIQSLTDELNRNISELQNIRRDNTTRSFELQAKLDEKNEELKIANSRIGYLEETVQSLTAKSEELANKLNMNGEDTTKLMDQYRKEIQASARLIDLHKEESDDYMSEIEQLTNVTQELRQTLKDALDKYGELETKYKAVELKHEQDIEEKDKVIQSLRDELKHANDLLTLAKNENLEKSIENLAPSAAVMTKLIKSDTSLTELYSMYVKAVEEAQLQTKENSKLRLQINSIIQELEEKAPMVAKKNLDYEKILEANNELTQQIENLIQEKVDLRHEMQLTIDKIQFIERENKKLRTSQQDMGRQLCYLLRTNEQLRSGFNPNDSSDQQMNGEINDIISKKLVTFNSINELQENNQRLIMCVRDLTVRLEEVEKEQADYHKASFDAKMEKYTKRLEEMQKLQSEQTQALNNCIEQREKYKTLYFNVLKSPGKSSTINNQSLNNTQMSDVCVEDGLNGESTQQIPASGDMSVDSLAGGDNKEIAVKDKKIADLENKIKELQEKIQFMKDEHKNYKEERMTNDKMLNEQFDKMRTEIRELTSSNCKLMTNLEYANEQIKIAQKNMSYYKNQIQTLEERNKNYENSIMKHEQTVMYLRDEAMSSQQKLAHVEVQLDNLRQKCQISNESEHRLQLERDMLLRERQTHSLVLNNIEMLKANFERSETEGRQRIENRLDEAQRECSVLRRRLQEEQDRFRELTDDLNRQTNTAKERMEEEKAAANKLRSEVQSLREEIIAKSKQIDELSKKLQESLTPNKNDNPIAQANKKAREFELKYEQAAIDIESLKKELELTREHSQQYFKMSQSTERELKELHEIYTDYKNKTEDELKVLRASEANLKSRIEELQTEIQLQISGAQINSGQTTNQIDKVQAELKQALEKLSENNRDMRKLRDRINELEIQLQTVEKKYTNELSAHLSAEQDLRKSKEEISLIREQIDEYREGRDRAVHVLEESKKGWFETEKKLKEGYEEIEKRLIDLNSQNATLHDQIELLSSKIALSQLSNSSGKYDSNKVASNDESMDDSSSGMNSSLLNRSITNEDESRNSNQLLQIVKYLRKEKDIAFAKVDILKSENSRLLSEATILQKKINEYQDLLNKQLEKSNSVVVTAAKHDEILRKIETLNAVTDSNRILREERDALSSRINELTSRVSKAEDELFPLQEKNRELLSKIEEISIENTSLRSEASRWRQRANLLIERSNRNPEDFKRIQSERESLAKLLSAEKETLKQAQEELQNVKNEKQRLDIEVANLGRQIQLLTEDKRKLIEEVNTLKDQSNHMAHEIMRLKKQLNDKDDELKKIGEELSAKDAQLLDSENKVVQIRKIAKRYKDSFFELKNKEGERIDSGDNPGTGDGGDSQQGTGDSGPSTKQLLDNEKELKDKINELNSQIQSLQEENIQLQKDVELWKERTEKEERNKFLLKEAKTRIVTLTEKNTVVTKELTDTQKQLQTLELSREEQHNVVSNIKSQFEQRIARLEKEHNDQEKETKETIARLNRENETLMMRVNQLHRQLGMQQISKPSTSSGSGSDKSIAETPRTANVKPMSGPSGQQSATVTPWRGGETPLASIRPMSVQNSRTAAVLPTSQTSMVGIQGSSSVTALVPPQQQVHTTGNSSGEAMSSSPTSSHTDYMPATSSAAVVVAAIPPMGASAESSQEAESIPTQNNESSSSSSQIIVSAGQQQQAVALVSPRIEGAQSISVPLSSAAQQSQETNQPSTSGTSGISNVSVSSHHQASSSNTVTTTQAASGHKRPRDVEGDSSTSNEEPIDKSQQQSKRTRMQTGEVVCQGVSESGLEIEIQVPTSSQRDQEDDIIIVDSEEDDGMPDEGNADDGPMEDEVDNGEGYEIEEQDIDENEGPDIDEDNVQSDNNEVEVDDSSEVPNQSGNNQVAPDAGACQIVDQSSSTNQGSESQNPESQQIQTISSGSDASGFSSQVTTQSTSGWRQATALSRQQQATLLMLQQGYEETGDDSIVPSTPTLFAPRRADGFSEAVSSPNPQVPHPGRFTFSDTSSRQALVASAEGIPDEARADLSDEAGGRSVPSTPQQTSPQRSGESSISTAIIVEGTSSTEKGEQSITSDDIQDAGPSNSEGSVPEITVTTANNEDTVTIEGASTSDVLEESQDQIEEGDIEEEGMDGVTSEGEKPMGGANDSSEMEEGREAEATTSHSINTRKKNMRGGTSSARRSGNRNGPGGNRRTPIVWQEVSRGNRSMTRSNDSNIQQYQNQQRGTRNRRRPTTSNFNRNMRY